MLSSQCRRYLIVLVFLAFCLKAIGQVNTADVTGFVTDSTGAAIAGATVEITSTTTGIARDTKSNNSGVWSVPSLIPGTYAVQISKPGFAPAKVENIHVSANEVRHVDVTMKVGATSQVVQVRTSSVINLNDAQQQTTLGARQLSLLPVPNRDWTSMVTQGNGLSMDRDDRGVLSMNGLPGGATSITVDGVPSAGQAGLPSFGLYQNFNLIKQVGQQAIQEINITRGIAPADVGATMTGNVNVITKSGTNQFHGTILWLDNNTVFNASNPFSQQVQPVIQNQYAASLGGPIVRNKLFFFADYEGFHITNSAFAQLTVPTPELIAEGEAAVPAYKTWFDLMPLANTPPYDPGQLSAKAGISEPNQSHDNYGNLRVDYYPSSNWRLIMRYSTARPFSKGGHNALLPIYGQQYFGYSQGGSAQVLYTHGNTIYEGRFGVSLNDELRTEGPPVDLTNSIRKFNGIDTGSFETLFVGGLDEVYEGKITKQMGHHLIKIGGGYHWDRVQSQDESAPELRYKNLNDFLANIPNQVKTTPGLSLYNLPQYSIGFYFQDNWKISDRLTLNEGIRWDYFAPAGGGNPRFFNRMGPYGTGDYFKPGTTWNKQWTDFSPRFGLAYQLDPSGKTVLRTGAGVFYNGHDLYRGPEGGIRDAVDEPHHGTFSRNDVLAHPDILRFPVITANTIPLSKEIDSASALNPEYPNPYSVQWLVGLEQQFTPNWGFHLKYVGNVARHLMIIREINRPEPDTGDYPYPGLGTFDYYDPAGSSNYNALQASLMHQFSHGFQWNLYYTWSHALAHSNEADIIAPTQLQDSFNIADDYGPSDIDIRNRMVSNILYAPLFSHILGSGCKPVLCDGWAIGAVVEAHSGHAINVIQSSGNSGSRPDRIPGIPLYLPNYRETRLYLNPAAFSLVPLGAGSGNPIRGGNMPRDGANAPGFFNTDITLSRTFSLTHGVSFRFEADALNAFNHVNYDISKSDDGLDVTSSSFGLLTGLANSPRKFQFTGQLNF